MASLKEWIKGKEALSIMRIEKDLNMPQSTLYKYINGSRALPTKYRAPLGKYLKRYGFNGTFD